MNNLDKAIYSKLISNAHLVTLVGSTARIVRGLNLKDFSFVGTDKNALAFLEQIDNPETKYAPIREVFYRLRSMSAVSDLKVQEIDSKVFDVLDDANLTTTDLWAYECKFEYGVLPASFDDELQIWTKESRYRILATQRV